MKAVNKNILLKSDYLRKEAELYIDFISKGENLENNKFMRKSLKEINEGSKFLNNWVYEQTISLLQNNKLVGLMGGDHSTPLGFFKAIGEYHGSFGILQIDAHCDLRIAYEDFKYSHASIMYNALNEIPQLKRLIQVGVRDYGQDEWEFIQQSNQRIVTFFDKDIKYRQYEGQLWKNVCDEIVDLLPEKVFISFDIDGLDPKLCPNTGTPVEGGLEADQVNYLFKKVLQSGRKIIGFDLNEIGIGENDWDANVGARELYKLCNLMIASSLQIGM